jgi:threonine aldolase
VRRPCTVENQNTLIGGIKMNFIDLRSDTVTQPTQKMRDAMYIANVGDDVYEDDITIKELEEYVSTLTGKEAGLFVPSGSFGNQLSILTHTSKGSEVIVGDDSHIIQHEVGAAGLISGVQLRTIDSDSGVLAPQKIESKIRIIDDIHYPKTSLICLENAHSNGKVIPQTIMKQTYEIAKQHNIPIHLDGARVFNAATYLNIDVKEIIKYTDSTMFCLSKGLAAPVGSMIVGSKLFIENARKNRKLMGGGLRQAGFLAAAGLVALKEMIPNLKLDNEKAIYMAKELEKIEEVSINVSDVHINLVFFKIKTDKNLNCLQDFMLQNGIKINGHELNNFRVVLHHGVTMENIDKYISTLSEFLK